MGPQIVDKPVFNLLSDRVSSVREHKIAAFFF